MIIVGLYKALSVIRSHGKGLDQILIKIEAASSCFAFCFDGLNHGQPLFLHLWRDVPWPELAISDRAHHERVCIPCCTNYLSVLLLLFFEKKK